VELHFLIFQTIPRKKIYEKLAPENFSWKMTKFSWKISWKLYQKLLLNFFHENFRGIFPGNPIFHGKKCTRNQPLGNNFAVMSCYVVKDLAMVQSRVSNNICGHSVDQNHKKAIINPLPKLGKHSQHCIRPLPWASNVCVFVIFYT
jgi:hypothetical protein